jgi:glycosyltransferase involved in cell wall biosynthesis
MLFPIAWNEPFGLVIMEAMACGTPVLAFRIGSVPEIVRDGVSGYVARRRDDLAKLAQQLQIAPATVRKYVEEYFSIERMSRDYLDLYTDVALKGRVAA